MSETMFLNLTDVRGDNLEWSILKEITQERDRQQLKWGIQTHSIAEWLMILGEEYGESCKAGNECYFRDDSLAHLRKELVQTMAVALAIIEGLDMKPSSKGGEK